MQVPNQLNYCDSLDSSSCSSKTDLGRVSHSKTCCHSVVEEGPGGHVGGRVDVGQVHCCVPVQSPKGQGQQEMTPKKNQQQIYENQNDKMFRQLVLFIPFPTNVKVLLWSPSLLDPLQQLHYKHFFH